MVTSQPLLVTRAQLAPPQKARRGLKLYKPTAPLRVIQRRLDELKADLKADFKAGLDDLKAVVDRGFKEQGSQGVVLGAVVEGIVRQQRLLHHVLPVSNSLAKGEEWRQPAWIRTLSDASKHYQLGVAEKDSLASAVLEEDKGLVQMLLAVADGVEAFADANQASVQQGEELEQHAENIRTMLEAIKKDRQDVSAWTHLREGVVNLREAVVIILKANKNQKGSNTTSQILALAISYCTAAISQDRAALVTLLEQDEGLFVAMSWALLFNGRLQMEVQLSIAGVAAMDASGTYCVELAEVKAGAVGGGIRQLKDRLQYSWWILRGAGFKGKMQLHGRLLMVAGDLPDKQKPWQCDADADAEITVHKIVL